jgi:cytochrome c peroxidase
MDGRGGSRFQRGSGGGAGFVARREPRHANSGDDRFRAFKVPSLRNVALTAPYMINGTFLTLRQVMDFYEGGGAHVGGSGRLPNQTLPTDSLHLTPSERDAVIALLQALTDSSVRPDRVKINVPDNHTSP